MAPQHSCFPVNSRLSPVTSPCTWSLITTYRTGSRHWGCTSSLPGTGLYILTKRSWSNYVLRYSWTKYLPSSTSLLFLKSFVFFVERQSQTLVLVPVHIPFQQWFWAVLTFTEASPYSVLCLVPVNTFPILQCLCVCAPSYKFCAVIHVQLLHWTDSAQSVHGVTWKIVVVANAD